MLSASLWTSWLNWVCKFDNLFFNAAMPIMTIFSGFNAPELSTLKKYLFGLASQLKGASSNIKYKNNNNNYYNTSRCIYYSR